MQPFLRRRTSSPSLIAWCSSLGYDLNVPSQVLPGPLDQRPGIGTISEQMREMWEPPSERLEEERSTATRHVFMLQEQAVSKEEEEERDYQAGACGEAGGAGPFGGAAAGNGFGGVAGQDTDGGDEDAQREDNLPD